jgi:hypothetical protein
VGELEAERDRYTYYEGLSIGKVAERNRCLSAVDYIRGMYPESVFTPDGTTVDAESARWARKVCDNIRDEIIGVPQNDTLGTSPTACVSWPWRVCKTPRKLERSAHILGTCG